MKECFTEVDIRERMFYENKHVKGHMIKDFLIPAYLNIYMSTHTYTHIYAVIIYIHIIYTYIYTLYIHIYYTCIHTYNTHIYVCVYMCVCALYYVVDLHFTELHR